MKTKKNFLKKLAAVTLGFVMTLGVGAAGYAASAGGAQAASTKSITITYDGFDGSPTYNNGLEYTGDFTYDTSKSLTIGCKYVQKESNTDSMQMQASNANIYNKTALPGRLVSIVLTQTGTSRPFSAYGGDSQLIASNNTDKGLVPDGTSLGNTSSAATMTWTAAASTDYRYFAIHKGSNAGYVPNIVVTFEVGGDTPGPGPQPSGDILFDFEPESAHTSSGSNDYTAGTKHYTQYTDDDISLNYSDSISNTGIEGSYLIRSRVAKNTTNSPVVILGPIDISNKKVTSIDYYYKTGSNVKLTTSYSTNNSAYNVLDSNISSPSSVGHPNHENLNITSTGGNFYIKFSFSVSSSTSSNRDSDLDNVRICCENSVAKYTVTLNPNTGTGGTTSVEVENGSDMPTLESLPTKAGNIFAGYYDATTGGTKYYNDDGTSAKKYDKTSSLTLYAHWTAKTHIELSADDLDLDLQDDANGVAPLNPNYTTGVSYVVDDTRFATYSNGKFYPVAVGETLVTMSKTEDATNVYDDCIFTITVSSSIKSYSVSWTGVTNADVSGSDTIYDDGGSEEYTITANSGYKLPDLITVSGATQNYNKTTYNSATLTLSNPTADVTISFAAVALSNYGITFEGSNYTPSGSSSIQEFGQITITLTAATHYDLPTDVTVTGATKESYTKSTGELVIKNPTGAVKVSVSPVARERYSISVVGNGEYKSHFSYSGDTEIYATESASVTITPDTSTDDIYVINASNISVTGVSNTDWSYSNGVVSLANPSGNVTITVTPVKKILNSISITTNPTKTTGYKNGDTLDITGLVVKANYTTGQETIQNSDLKFSHTVLAVSGAAGTPQNETIYVYYGGKSASFTVSVSPVASGTVSWNKVTSEPTDWSGEYLLVYESDTTAYVATGVDTAGGDAYETATISDSKILTKPNGTASLVIEQMTGGYSIKLNGGSNNGKYITSTADSNGITFGTTETKMTLSYSNNTVLISNNGGAVLRFNSTGTEMRFRFFKSTTYTNQKAIQLYKYESVPASPTPVAINASFPTGTYSAGDTINLSNITTSLIYSDGTSNSVAATSISPATFVEGTHEYEVSYTVPNTTTTLETNIQIANVGPAKQMVGIEINTDNVIKAFVVGGDFNSDGLVVNAVYDNGDRELITSGYTVTPPDMTSAGTKDVTVSYQSFEPQTYQIEISNSPIMNIVKGAVIDGYVGETYEIEVELLNFSGTSSWSLDPASSEYYSLSNISESSTGYSADLTLNKVCEDLTLEISEANSGADPVEISISAKVDEIVSIEAPTSSQKAFIAGKDELSKSDLVVTYTRLSGDTGTLEPEEFELTNAPEGILARGSYTFTVTSVENEDASTTCTITASKPTDMHLVTLNEQRQGYYQLVTNNNDLTAGSKYIIVGIKNDIYYGMKQYLEGNNVRAATVNTPVNNRIAYSSTTENTEITLGKTSDNWTLFDGKYYLYAAGGTGTNNYLKGADNADAANAQWTISVASNGAATIKTVDSTVARHTMRFNTNGNNDPLFSCYASGQSDVYLYKLVEQEPIRNYADNTDISDELFDFVLAHGSSLSESNWNTVFDSFEYKALSDDDKGLLKYAVASNADKSVTTTDMFKDFIADYDEILALNDELENYLDRPLLTPYTVTINYDNGQPNSSVKLLPDDNTYTLPDAPTKEEFVFNGWNVNGVTKQPGDTIIVTADITITAQWVVGATITNSVEFNFTGLTMNRFQYVFEGTCPQDAQKSGFLVSTTGDADLLSSLTDEQIKNGNNEGVTEKNKADNKLVIGTSNGSKTVSVMFYYVDTNGNVVKSEVITMSFDSFVTAKGFDPSIYGDKYAIAALQYYIAGLQAE